jgi:ATPase subunit of ABC transporter with duplicated ATPase domains
MISFSNINKQYGKQSLFVDASFQLNPGEKVGLVGPNGAGKTTAILLTQYFLVPRSRHFFATLYSREKTVNRRREKTLSAQSVGFLRSLTQLPARLPLVLLAEALKGQLRSQGI